MRVKEVSSRSSAGMPDTYPADGTDGNRVAPIPPARRAPAGMVAQRPLEGQARSLRRRAARADRLSARRGEGMPPRLPILASRAPRELQRPPRWPQARAEAAGVAAEACPPR